MKLRHRIIQKVTAVFLAAVMLIGGGTPTDMLCRVLPAAAAESEAPIASAVFTAPRTVTEFLKGTKSSEKGLRATFDRLFLDSDYKQYEEKGYSVIYSTNLETNFALFYNPAHVDIPGVLSTPNGQAWAHTYSRYLTALSQITGTNIDLLLTVIDTDIIYGGCGVSYGPFTIITKRWAYEAVTAMLNNKISWTLMHETAHCYNDHENARSFVNSEEDVYVNLRGLAAFHLMGIDTEKMIIEHAAPRLIRTDCDLDDKYKDSELFPLKDPQYQAFYPEGSTLWSRPEYDAESSVSLSFLSSFLAEACADSGTDLFYVRLASILDLVTKKPIMSSCSDEPTDCNNWRNTDAINANWNTISEESWQKLYALCIVYQDQTAIPGINDKVLALYQKYTGQMTETVRYSRGGETVYTVKVTPNVLKMMQKHCKKEDGIYQISGAEIQVMNLYDFMGKDFETTPVFHRDSEGGLTSADACSFYLDSGLEFDDYAYRGFETDPAITKQPEKACAAAGETAKFSVSAEGKDLTYQWQFYDGSGWKNSNASGYDTDTLKVTANPAWEGRLYRCKVSYPNGEYELSKSAALHLNVRIIKEPTDVTQEIGKEAVFSVEAAGSGELSYRWMCLSGPEWDEWKDFTGEGAGTPTIRINVTEDFERAWYYCIVKSSNGTSAQTKVYVIHAGATVTKQPESVSLEVGKTAVFSVSAAGGGTLSYQWQYNDGSGWKNSDAPGADTASMRLTIKAEYEGLKYRCVVNSTNGSAAISDTAVISTKTVITKQPADASGYIGDTALFSVKAAGSGLTYKWQYNSGDGWKDSTLSGNKTAALSVPVTAQRDGLQFRCIVTDAGGNTKTSSAASLKVLTGITKQPVSANLEIGKNAVFTVEATGAGTLSYQWQYNEGAGWKDSTASGAKTASMSISVTAARDGLQYRCAVTSSNGTSALSEPAAIKVKTNITKQPADVSTEIGNIARFSVEAAGGGTLSYQWQYNNGSGWKNSEAPGADTASMRMTVKESYDGLQYRCIVTSSGGMSVTSEAASLTVKTAVLTHPESMMLGVGAQETLTVEASGAGTLRYQWQYNDGAGWKNTTETGAKTDSLHLTGSVAHENRQYRCVVTSSNGSSATTNAAAIKVSATITKQPENAKLAVGQNAVFTIAAAGAGTLSYQWQYNDGSGWKNSTASGAATASVSIKMQASYENMKYRCIVKSSNGTETVSCAAAIRVNVTITKQPADVTQTAGKNAVFTVAASGGGTLSYQWQYKSGAGWTNSTAHGANTASLAISVTAARDGLQYRCIVTSTNATYAVSDAAAIHLKRITGDANSDAACTIADAVMLQKWLLCAGNLTDWKAADMNGDKKINAVDLTLLKRKLMAA